MSALAGLVEKQLMAPDWAEALAPVDEQVAAMGRFLRAEIAEGRPYLPAGDAIFRAFRAPLADVRVLIVGQDPYPTPGNPIGLSFAVERGRRVPQSLGNIYRELHDDVGVDPPRHGDLTAWSTQGVMLLNRVLTVQPGAAGSHQGKGWEAVTDRAVQALAERAADGAPLVAILWGSKAQQLKRLLGPVPSVESTHPSPMSANRGGFFGTRPFSRVNALLVEQGGSPIDWSLPA